MCLWIASLLVLIVFILIAKQTVREFVVYKNLVTDESPFIDIDLKQSKLLIEGNIRDGKKYRRIRIYELGEKKIAILGEIHEKAGRNLLHRYRSLDDLVLKNFCIHAKCYEGIRSIPQYFGEEVFIICLVFFFYLAFQTVAIRYQEEGIRKRTGVAHL